MSLALYRRYRPETFAEVIGQEHVTAPLQQALRNNRVNHAYLFSGPRGCGKTTSARILARCLNCAQGPTPTPCGECQSCTDLATGGPGSIDVIEIDAASHGGVDDARDLRERAFFAPVHSRYKIFILDEAHMVTSAGFNALLKVVEEPPEHLKFIFATTEPEKVIGTIRSRTHHYPFRLVPPGTLRDYLAQVCEREQIAVEDSVFPLVVRSGAGSVRDSMSVMDQLLAGAGEGGVTYPMATALLGYTDSVLLDEVVDAFAVQDGATVFQVVDRVVEGGHDPRRFVTDLLERLRDLVILATVPDAGEKGLIDAPADRVAIMQAQADRFGPADLSRAADLVNTGLTEMRGNSAPRLQLELICARVMLPGAYGDELSLQARLDKLERRAAAGGFAAPQAQQAQQAQHVQQAPSLQAVPGPAPAPVAQAMPAPVQQQPAPPVEVTPSQPAAAPGAWPIARSFPSAGAPAQEAPAPAPAPVPAAVQPQAPAPQQQPTAGQPSVSAQQGAGQVRQLWPQILEAVKNRRRFTWILLSQNGQVAGFDGSTLQVSFINAGARDSFVGSNSDDVLKQALADALGVDWRVECIVDPSGGTSGGVAGGTGTTPPPSTASWGAPQQQQSQQQPARPAPVQAAPPQVQPTPPPQQAAAPSAPRQAPAPVRAPAPTPVDGPPADEYPPDDYDLEGDASFTGPSPTQVDQGANSQELIVRELGATVLEEIHHNR
ncbi:MULTISPECIES: DNA polymerase III subunit gamma and tau [unclassified Kitasatospora]|uniref:DNA polymerase III subunit gamma and tau n=1 Tax=unclassified Kitasatospora TaxID=2633591 RepID=UPI00070A6BFC|nr:MULTISPECIES: DNA polymerase III subunit gamma and tau [unclassified Kitasatospora]KQV15360.1 DNA polymerase III subunit gamma/tau [Kitasatospora sp. Root107]KRB64051.1 DNA polymerase III subunit gamma/tau [Kitasatospora sp. Root187]